MQAACVTLPLNALFTIQHEPPDMTEHNPLGTAKAEQTATALLNSPVLLS